MAYGNIAKNAIITADDASLKIPELYGLKTGVNGLDNLFYMVKIENGIPRKTSLGGYPYRAVINITGVPDTGKSLMVEQFTVIQSSLGRRVCFVTVESPSAFIAYGLKLRAEVMGLDWSKIKGNIVIIDAASHIILREDLKTLLSTLKYAIESYNTEIFVMDSVTGLYEAKEMLARSIVREIFNLAKRMKQTAVLVSQKRSGHQPESAEAAGGYAVSHIVDCTIVLGKKLIQTKWDQNIYGVNIGEVVRTLRIDGCRLCGHDTSTHLLNILDTGIVEVGPPLQKAMGGEEK